jgi:hypothetical protein
VNEIAKRRALVQPAEQRLGANAQPIGERIAIPDKQALMVEAALVAPDEIRTEVEHLVESFQPIFDLFEAADFEAGRINQAAFSRENSTRGRIMDDWVSTNCDG